MRSETKGWESRASTKAGDHIGLGLGIQLGRRTAPTRSGFAGAREFGERS